jgi:lipoate---protein ligase
LIALSSSSTDPHANLALEEALLEGPLPAGGLLLLYVDGPCAVIGRNQNPWIELRAGSGLPVIRRVSGGGTVYHDEGNLNWSIVAPREAHDRCAELALVVAALAGLGVEAAADERGAIRIAGAGARAGDKVSGSARRLLRDRVLHHGTLLVDADLEAMASCLGGIEADSAASPASVPSRVVNLSSIVEGLRVGDAASALASAFAGRPAEPAEPSADAEAVARCRARLRSWEWTYGATPPFSIRVEGGGLAARLELRGGIVAAATGQGASALGALIGLRFDHAIPAAAAGLLAHSVT